MQHPSGFSIGVNVKTDGGSLLFSSFSVLLSGIKSGLHVRNREHSDRRRPPPTPMAEGLSSASSEKAQSGEQGWSEEEKRKGDIGLETKEIWSKGQDPSRSRSKSMKESRSTAWDGGGQSRDLRIPSSGSDIYPEGFSLEFSISKMMK